MSLIVNGGEAGYGQSALTVGPDGTLYYVSFTASAVAVRYCTDSDPVNGTWSLVGGTTPTASGGPYYVASCHLGNTLHIAWYDVAGGTVWYSSVNTATKTWSVLNDSVEVVSPNNPSVDIAARSDGSVVVVYGGATDRVMGKDYNRVDMRIREAGGTWGSVVALSGADGTNYLAACCVRSTYSDNVHITFLNDSDSASAPPTTTSRVNARTVRGSDDSLSTLLQSPQSNGKAAYTSARCVVPLSASQDRMLVGLAIGTDGEHFYEALDSGGDIGSIAFLSGHPSGMDIYQDAIGRPHSALVSLGDHVVFVTTGGNEGGGGTEGNVFTAVSTDAAATLFGTPELKESNASVLTVAGAILLNRDGGVVLGYVRRLSSIISYLEVSFTAPTFSNLSDGSMSLPNSRFGPFEV